MTSDSNDYQDKKIADADLKDDQRTAIHNFNNEFDSKFVSDDIEFVCLGGGASPGSGFLCGLMMRGEVKHQISKDEQDVVEIIFPLYYTITENSKKNPPERMVSFRQIEGCGLFASRMIVKEKEPVPRAILILTKNTDFAKKYTQIIKLLYRRSVTVEYAKS